MPRKYKYEELTVSDESGLETNDNQDDEVKLIEKKENKSDTLIAGYRLGELARAPLDPPLPLKTEPKEVASNNKVKTLLLIGVVVALFGVVIIFTTFSLWLGLLIMVVGAVVVTAGVFLPVR